MILKSVGLDLARRECSGCSEVRHFPARGQLPRTDPLRIETFAHARGEVALSKPNKPKPNKPGRISPISELHPRGRQLCASQGFRLSREPWPEPSFFSRSRLATRRLSASRVVAFVPYLLIQLSFWLNFISRPSQQECWAARWLRPYPAHSAERCHEDRRSRHQPH